MLVFDDSDSALITILDIINDAASLGLLWTNNSSKTAPIYSVNYIEAVTN